MHLQRFLPGKVFLILAISLVYFPICANAAELFLGISVNQAHLEDDEGSSINPQESDKDFNLSFAARSFDSFWGKTKTGYYLEFGIDTFTVEDHTVWGLVEKEDIYTSTSGEYFYLVPIAFYEFNKSGSPNWSFKVGVGAGIGYLTIDGTVIANRPAGTAVEHINGSDFSFTTGLVIKYEYNNFVFQAKEFTPKGTIDGLNLELQLPSISIGYKFDV